MTGTTLDVILSGAKIGTAETWKEAEFLVNSALRKRGRKVPAWDGDNTVQTETAFKFSLKVH
jgi:hypothetical protein